MYVAAAVVALGAGTTTVVFERHGSPVRAAGCPGRFVLTLDGGTATGASLIVVGRPRGPFTVTVEPRGRCAGAFSASSITAHSINAHGITVISRPRVVGRR